jgi:hypothetical protein
MSHPSSCSLHQEECKSGEPRKPTIQNAWFQLWNMEEVLWWFGLQCHGILLVTLLPFMAKSVQRSAWTGWVIRCILWSRHYFWTTQFSRTTMPPFTQLELSWFEEHESEHLPWPAQSPDLIITEPFWSVLDTRMRSWFQPPTSLKQLEDVLQEEWHKIPLELENLYEPILR